MSRWDWTQGPELNAGSAGCDQAALHAPEAAEPPDDNGSSACPSLCSAAATGASCQAQPPQDPLTSRATHPERPAPR